MVPRAGLDKFFRKKFKLPTAAKRVRRMDAPNNHTDCAGSFPYNSDNMPNKIKFQKRMVPRAGLEPAQLSLLPPQDSVSTNSTTWALFVLVILDTRATLNSRRHASRGRF